MEILSEYVTSNGRSIFVCEDILTYQYVVMTDKIELFRANSMGSIFNFLISLGEMSLIRGGL